MSAQADLSAQAARHGLFTMGQTPHPEGELILIGADQGIWPAFTASPEYNDGAPDPLDRWSKRLIRALAAPFEAQTFFPSDGPPFAPFIRWAQESGRFWQSPVGMLIHDQAGLMISIRGAVLLPEAPRLPPTKLVSPCNGCAQPCRNACPVDALSHETGYQVDKCKAYLDTAAGQDCMTQGCRARRACPVSQSFDRDPAQSAFHMSAFKG